MITFRVDTDVTDERLAVIPLPPEIPLGKARLLVTVEQSAAPAVKPFRRSLADWADSSAEHWGDLIRSDAVEAFTGRSF
ncbi:MAG: hypothetical protein EXS05_14535 [Planctomycetaceae bacterium]|nr:hypothetical protein [Planctomycetaceae bacterium]